MTRLARDEGGATAIEFALASTALLLFVFGIIEMARMLWTQQVLQGAAAETARCLAIGSSLCPSAGTFAATAAANRGVGDVQTGQVTVSASDSCNSTSGTFTKVTIAYGFSTVLPAYIPVPAGGLTAVGCFPH